jgi:hypothetical protein
LSWFKAKDVAKKDNTPFKKKPLATNSPQVWEPFSVVDNEIIEQKYLQVLDNEELDPLVVTVGHDGLYEVNTKTFEFAPIYWDGPIYEVRRGIWFEQKGIS